MPDPSVLIQVSEGWKQLAVQRPLAAWACWQRALRIDPDDAAARQAIESLETAPDLPAAARAVYRFAIPSDASRRARWDSRLKAAGDLDNLNAAADVFEALAADDPQDAEARSNLALCLAWLGRNTEAIEALDLVVALLAGPEPERAAGAWTLAEVLRLGAGAEALADDLRYVWTVAWPEGRGAPPELTDRWLNLRPLSTPIDPVTGSRKLVEGSVFEWLDRPWPVAAAVHCAADLPRVLATVIDTPSFLRVSTPDPAGFDALDEPGLRVVAEALRRARREAAPLPLAWADALLGVFRFPAGLSEAAKRDLTRGAVEHEYEDLWIHRPRRGLGGLSPIQAAHAATGGDAVIRAKLEGIVRFRAQLGARPSHAAIYQGYPFDRLRRRLGLIGPQDSPAVDPADLSCAGGAELDTLDPSRLDGEHLAEALTSAIGLRGDERTARFAAEIIVRAPPSFARLNAEKVVAPLVREALRLDNPDQALEWIGRATVLVAGDPARRRTFAIWSAEVLAGHGRPGEAVAVYRGLLDDPAVGNGTELALDGAETLLVNGYPDESLPLLLEARDRASAGGDRVTLDRVESLLALGR